jgi:hypothetical protein
MDTNNKVTIKVVNRTGKKLQTFLYGLGEEFDLHLFSIKTPLLGA